MKSTDLGNEVEKNEMEVRRIAHTVKRKNAYISVVRNPEKRYHLKI